MASIIPVAGKWRAQVRRKGHRPQTRTFESKAVAEKWARKVERAIDAGEFHDTGEHAATTLQDVIDQYRKERQKTIGRSHGYALKQIEHAMGPELLSTINSDRIIRYARGRQCAPSTWAPELSYLGQILRIARAVWRMPIVGDPVGDARAALGMLGYRMKSAERDRRLADGELAALVAYFAGKQRQRIPMDKIIPFAVATTMRAEEITRILWADVNELLRTVIIRDRKDPQEKEGNDQIVPLLPDAWAIVQTMPRSDARIFPFNHKSFSSIFPRACQALDPPIVGLRFHDLRHEGISRLFEAGYTIPEVAILSGHRDWKMLKRYTQIKAETLHRMAAVSPSGG